MSLVICTDGHGELCYNGEPSRCPACLEIADREKQIEVLESRIYEYEDGIRYRRVPPTEAHNEVAYTAETLGDKP